MLPRVALAGLLVLLLPLLYAVCGVDRSDQEAPETASPTPVDSDVTSAEVARPAEEPADEIAPPTGTPAPDADPGIADTGAMPPPEPVEAPSEIAEVRTVATPEPPKEDRTPEPPIDTARTPTGTLPLAEPTDGTRLTRRLIPVEIDFAWSAGSRTDGYLIEIARDSEFRNLVDEFEVSEPRFRHTRLVAGSYYWRVAGMNGGNTGSRSAASSFEIVHDDEPPALDVAYPAGPVDGNILLLSGSTEPGARVFHGEDAVPTGDDGSFEIEVTLARGANVVTVEAIDPAGNVAYRSQMVAADY
jgi:hypothetical protein